MTRIAVLGAGAWGTALAASLARGGREVMVWGRDPHAVRQIAQQRRNERYLRGIALPELRATTELDRALDGASVVLCVVPVAATAATLARARDALDGGASVVLCSKGIAPAGAFGSGGGKPSVPLPSVPPPSVLLPSALAAGALGGSVSAERIGALSGPSFAVDVASGLPTAVSLAMPGRAEATRLAEALSSPALRCYATDDLRGVELGGALKNVIAIGAGIARGRGLGASAHAALVTRGHGEMTRIAVALGGRAETLAGLSGLGDLLLTASSAQSRNFAYGLALGRGEAPPAATVEGVRTAATAAALANERGLRAPIIEALRAILHRGADIADTIAALLERPLPPEE